MDTMYNSEIAEELEAHHIEMDAANISYEAGFGVSEWESFLTMERGFRLAELARRGRGTWGREGRIPPPYDAVSPRVKQTKHATLSRFGEHGRPYKLLLEDERTSVLLGNFALLQEAADAVPVGVPCHWFIGKQK